MTRISSARWRLAVVLAFAALSCTQDQPFAPLTGQPLFVLTPPPAIIISQVYGGGGNAGSTYRNDFIELFNPGTAPVSVAGWSVQYASATGTTWSVTGLSGTIPPGGYYLVQEAAGAGGTTNLPTPDATGGIAMALGAGKVFLALTTTLLTTACPTTNVMDQVSYGTTASNCGMGTTATLTNTTAAIRGDAGCAYTGSLPADFSTGAPAPRNSGSPTHACAVVPPPPEVTSVTVTPANATLFQSQTQQFTAAAFDGASPAQPIGGTAFAWSTSDAARATVSATGLATAVGVGDVTITATAPNGVAGTATLHVQAPPPAPDVRFSEIHYDNAATDIGEAVEIEGPDGMDVTGWSVLLYNGNGGVVYDTQVLSESFVTRCSGRGVIVIDYPTNGFQNGAPDGMALVDGDGHVVEFLSYEGSFTATDGPAAGLPSYDIGVAEEPPTPVGQSLQRNGLGIWQAAGPNSFGRCTSEGPAPPVSGISFSGRAPTDPPLPVGFESQIFATERDGATGATFSTTFTWSSETPSLASIDSRGVIHSLGEGTATFRATAADLVTATYSLPMAFATASATASYGNNTEFGDPTDADPTDDFIVRREQFATSYSPTRNTPNWVAYDLEATHIGTGVDRCNCFTHDPLLPATFTHLTTADYTGAGAFAGFGIDRGHMTRSFDRTTGTLDNALTYYLSNVVPQAADLNQGPWAILENYLGDLARNSNKEVYIVTGPAGNKGTVKGEGKIVIPTHTWKVAVIMPRDQGLADLHTYQDVEVIAVIMPNEPGVRNVAWETYRTTVDAVEAASGYDLLALLPNNIEGEVESNGHPPIANPGGPYSGFEGTVLSFDATGSTDADDDALEYDWDFGDGTTARGASPGHKYVDNGTFIVTVTVTDPVGGSSTAATTASVTNVSPVITVFTLPTDPIRLGSSVTAQLAFSDAGSGDSPVAMISWGDGTASTATSHVYAAPGLYTVSVTVADDDGGSASAAAPAHVVVYEANSSTSGAGWFGSARNKGLFAFTARYRRGRAQPVGVLEFYTNNNTFLFSATSLDWLVVNGSKAILRGSGAIGRTHGYQFLMVALENGRRDGFRLKIWNATGIVIYDNQPGQPDTSDVVTQLVGGSIEVR